MSDNIIWEDPPEFDTRGPHAAGKWLKVLKPLMEYPERWAVVIDYAIEKPDLSPREQNNRAYARASAFKHRKLVMPPGRWDAKGRNGKVYLRYMGPEEK